MSRPANFRPNQPLIEFLTRHTPMETTMPNLEQCTMIELEARLFDGNTTPNPAGQLLWETAEQLQTHNRNIERTAIELQDALYKIATELHHGWAVDPTNLVAALSARLTQEIALQQQLTHTVGRLAKLNNIAAGHLLCSLNRR